MTDYLNEERLTDAQADRGRVLRDYYNPVNFHTDRSK
jgi:hypothetical protein